MRGGKMSAISFERAKELALLKWRFIRDNVRIANCWCSVMAAKNPRLFETLDKLRGQCGICEWLENRDKDCFQCPLSEADGGNHCTDEGAWYHRAIYTNDRGAIDEIIAFLEAWEV
jgi:hypothetical protein